MRGYVVVVQTVLWRGRVQAMSMWRRTFRSGLTVRYVFPAKRHGASYVPIEAAMADRVALFVRDACAHTEFTGAMDVEVIVEDAPPGQAPKEIPKLMLLEFNPRFSGALQNALGSPVLDVYWALLHGTAPRDAVRHSTTVTPLTDTGVFLYYLRRPHLVPRTALGRARGPAAGRALACGVLVAMLLAVCVWRASRPARRCE